MSRYDPEKARQYYLNNKKKILKKARLRYKTNHLDHVIPLAWGGLHDISNLCLACPTCNLRKHIKTGDEFREQLKKELN
jgi:5-methylcytosine-specific restriction endonuclease McrA